MRARTGISLLLLVATSASAQRLIRLELDEADARQARMRETWQTADDWLDRAASIRRQILDVLDIPLADRAPLNADVTDTRTYDGYVVEDVSFDAIQGVRITGNLYRPVDARGRHPGILCPHGHFQPTQTDPEGRFRRDMQIRCAALARMGAVVLTYDMVGWAESDIADHDVPAALPLQTYNSVRAVDYLVSRPEVDPERLAVTGASGGGSQSFLLTAIDDRIDASVPVVMISSHFFGGCACETGLPLHGGDVETSNVEIAALAAPRPMLVISCGNDWTSRTPEVEFPYIRDVYEVLSAGKQVRHAHFADEGHDYGPSKRLAMYEFLATTLDLDLGRITDQAGDVDETFVTIEPRDVLCVRAEVPEKCRADEVLARVRARARIDQDASAEGGSGPEE